MNSSAGDFVIWKRLKLQLGVYTTYQVNFIKYSITVFMIEFCKVLRWSKIIAAEGNFFLDSLAADLKCTILRCIL